MIAMPVMAILLSARPAVAGIAHGAQILKPSTHSPLEKKKKKKNSIAGVPKKVVWL